MTLQHKLGQYFTTNEALQETVFKFILNTDIDKILEPSFGRGDLVKYIKNKLPLNVIFEIYELDDTIEFLEDIYADNINMYIGDFLTYEITEKYDTIIGNPPYIKLKKGNMYIDFIEKCYNLLNENAELIFIIPSDFFKLTSASKLITEMLNNGTFTHIYHPHNENLFKNASIDILIFRYCKNINLGNKVLYNGELMYLKCINGIITFNNTTEKENNILFSDYFDIYVGIVNGKEEVYKNEEFGNITVLNGFNKVEKYILLDKFPTEDNYLNEYMLKNKKKLETRKIKKFNENNWYEWGALRNVSSVNKNLDKDCIYIYNLTRKENVAFIGKVMMFGGGLLIMIPKKECNLLEVVKYLNSIEFKKNYIFSNRFKIGHKILSNSQFPVELE